MNVITPTRLRLGIAWRVQHAFLAIDADIAHEWIVPELQIERRLSRRIAMGGELHYRAGPAWPLAADGR